MNWYEAVIASLLTVALAPFCVLIFLVVPNNATWLFLAACRRLVFASHVEWSPVLPRLMALTPFAKIHWDVWLFSRIGCIVALLAVGAAVWIACSWFLDRRFLDARSAAPVAIGLGLYLSGMPDITDGLYNAGTALPYQFGLAMTVLVLAAAVRRGASGCPTRSESLVLFSGSLLAAAATPASCAFLLAGLTMLPLLKGSEVAPWQRRGLPALLGALVGTFVLVAACVMDYQASSGGGNASHALLLSLLSTCLFWSLWLGNGVHLLAALAVAPILADLGRHHRLRHPRLAGVSALLIGCLAAVLATLPEFLVSPTPDKKTLNAVYAGFLVTLLVVEFCAMAAWTERHRGSQRQELGLLLDRRTGRVLCLLTLMAIIGQPKGNWGAVTAAMPSAVTRRHEHQAQYQRLVLMARLGVGHLELKQVDALPVLGGTELETSATATINRAVAEVSGLAGISRVTAKSRDR